jgi:excisionase family DNA binding protein
MRSDTVDHVTQKLLTADEVADLLGLHVRTVRNYVRDGRLKAVRIGKQYRIAHADLEAFTGRPAEPAVRDAVTRRRHVGVSSIVEIDAISPETVSRVSTLLTSAAAHRRGGDRQLRLDIVHDEERAHLKIVVLGSLATSTDIFGLISAVIEEPHR